MSKRRKNKAETCGWIKDDLYDFAEITGIGGVSFMTHADHWLEIAIWLVLILVCFWRTVFDCQTAFDSYFGESSFTSLTVNSLKSMSFDEAKLCVNYNPMLFNMEVLSAKNVDQQLISFFLSPNGTFSFTSLDRISHRPTSLEKDIIVGITRMLGCYSGAENLFSFYFMNITETLTLISAALVEPFRAFFIKYNVTAEELRARTGDALCKLWRIAATTYANGIRTSTTSICGNVSRVTWLGIIPFANTDREATACYDVSDQMLFTSMTELREFCLDIRGIYPPELAPQIRSDGQFSLNAYLDFSGDSVSSDLSSSFIRFPDTGLLLMTIGVDGEYKMLSKRSKPCDALSMTSLKCFGTCRVKAFETLCSCFPDSWITQEQRERDDDLCFSKLSFVEYANCSMTLTRNELEKQCFRDECLSPCNFKVFRFTRGNIIVEKYGCSHGAVGLRLQPEKFFVPEFTEGYTVEFGTLLGNVGGIIGLWLGAGIIAIIHAIIFPLKIFVKFVVNGMRSTLYGKPPPPRAMREYALKGQELDCQANIVSIVEKF